MKIRKLFEILDEVRPNKLSMDWKLYWLSALEGKIAADIMLMAPAELQQFSYTDADLDNELLVEPPYHTVYLLWLKAQIDLEMGDYDKYQNGLILYQQAISELSIWFADNFNPAGSGPNAPQYFITAYGLAVKQGYTGSLDDWLSSYEGAASRAEAARDRAESAAGETASDAAESAASALAAVNAKNRAEQILTEIDPATISINTGNLVDGAVTEAKLAPGAVTEGKLGAGAVTEGKIGAGAVTETKLGAGAVTEGKLAPDSVTEGKIGAGAVTRTKIAPGAVGSGELAAGSVTGDKISPELLALLNPKYYYGTEPKQPGSPSEYPEGTLYFQYRL